MDKNFPDVKNESTTSGAFLRMRGLGEKARTLLSIIFIIRPSWSHKGDFSPWDLSEGNQKFAVFLSM